MIVCAFRLAALTLSWVAAAALFASAQTLSPVTGPSAPLASPPGVRQEGIYSTAPVVLDGAELFRIAALQNGSPDQLSLTLRQNYIETALGEATAATGSGSSSETIYDPKTIVVVIREDGAQDSLELVDHAHRDPLPLLTVNSDDSRYHRLSLGELASQWQSVLQGALEQALLKRQPAFARESLITVAQVAFGLTALTILAGIAVALLRRRMRAIERDVAEPRAEVDETASGAEPQQQRNRILQRALRNRLPSERLAFLSGAIGVIVSVMLLIWLAAITWALSLFPQTTPLAHVVARRSIAVVAILIFAGLAVRLLEVAVSRWAAWQFGTFATADERARRLLRGPTIASSINGFARFSVTFLAVLLVLSQVGIPVGSVVTIGGVAAIAVSFAAQNFVRDFIGGFLVLIEDQYVVGDYVSINGISGLVESVSLRMVQLRDASENLITIAHGTVTIVINESRYWSGLDYKVPIEPGADSAKAIELIKSAVEAPASVEWIGLDTLDRNYVLIRASIKTGPLRQFALRRELNARVHAAFLEAGIAFGALPA